MTVDIVTGEIVAMSDGSLSAEQVRARAAWVRDIKRAALVDGVDYGTIPGTGDRPALLLPGAEMLLFAAGYGFTIDERPTNRDGALYRCTVLRRDGSVVAQCDGYAGYDEPKYFVSAEAAEERERFYANKDKRPVRLDRCHEYRAPWNTLVKIAQKRAMVGAAKSATAASGLFVADVDDYADTDSVTPAKTWDTPATTAAPSRPNTAATTDTAKVTDPPCNEDDASEPAGRAALVEALNKAAPSVRTAFMAWTRTRGYEWPPMSSDVVIRCRSELDALVQRAREDSDAYGRR
jgi:hypothetical protein